MKKALVAGLVTMLLGAGTVCATTATARVGGLSADGSYVPFLTSRVIVDLLRPATGSGSFTTAAVIWAGGPEGGCSNAFHVIFYRPVGNGTTMMRLADRGTFAAPQEGLVNAPLSPAVSLEAGDVIAVDETGGPACGTVALGAAGGGAKAVAFSGSTGPSVALCSAPAAQLLLSSPSVEAFAGGTEFRDGIVAGVGSFQGSGTNFKSGMQLIDAGVVDIHGKLVFHPIGQPGASSDPSLPYSIAAGTVLSIPDVVGAMGVSGLGSIDVICDDSYPPLVITHVYNDAGAAGAAGFTEPTVRLGDPYVLQAGDEGWLVAPADLASYRMNIGIRSLSNGAAFQVTIMHADGTVVTSLSKSLPGDELIQQPVDDYLGTHVSADDTLLFDVVQGSAAIYGVSVNNVTNDTGQTFASRTRF
jgi:hypothetical protein